MLYEVITDNAEVVAVTESAKMPEPPTEMYADTKQQSDEAEQPEAQTENEARITSYNVCYTKLLCDRRLGI